jgi:hypothetical protein
LAIRSIVGRERGDKGSKMSMRALEVMRGAENLSENPRRP